MQNNQAGDRSTARIWPTLLGAGQSYVLGLPQNFNLCDAIRRAKKIRLATAFAHESGWRHLKGAITGGKAFADLLTGLEFIQTEPSVLKNWLSLSNNNPRVKSKVACEKPFFHPKVLIVTYQRKGSDFAIVGSGNLSEGGFCDNVECAIYIDDRNIIDRLCSWFSKHFLNATLLSDQKISRYEIAYEKAKEIRRQLGKIETTELTNLAPARQSGQDDWETRLVNEADRYFSTEDFKISYEERKKAAGEIRNALKFPKFNFDRKNFYEFYDIRPLGALDQRHKDGIAPHLPRIKKGLRNIFSERPNALQKLLDPEGDFYVKGFRFGSVTKILAACKPWSWPVWNGPVKHVLTQLGYTSHPGSEVEKYRDFTKKMSRLILAKKQRGGLGKNAIALDAFFYYKSTQN